MLQQHLFSAAVSTCLTSPRLHDKLRSVLVLDTDLVDKPAQLAFHRECRDILREALDSEEPRRFRTIDIDEVLEVLWPSTMFLKNTGATVPFFDALSALLFESTGSVIHFRDAALDDYTRLSARVDPALLLCWKIARDIGAGTLSTQQQVKDAVESVQPFCTPEADAGSKYADNHVHLSGASSEQIILMAALRGTNSGVADDRGPVAKKLELIEGLAHCLLLSGDKLNAESEKQIGELSRRALTPWRYSEPLPLINWTILRAQTSAIPGVWHGWIKHMLASSMVSQDLSRAWLWLLLWCAGVYQDKGCGPKRRIAIFLLLGTIMRVRKDVLVEGYGITRFVHASKNRRASAELDNTLQRSAARRIFHGSEDRAEVKVSPGMLDELSVRAWIRDVLALHSAPPSAVPGAAWDPCTRWHFCVHFSRTENSPWRDAGKIEAALFSKKVVKRNPLVSRNAGNTVTFAPARLIRTLDIAGDENLSKSEVFAPALRWLRSLTRPDGEAPLQLSIHAGEDYAHPLSGMRHIDETVQFCQMKNNDRIGHGLALGITPQHWFREQGQAMVSLEDHVDNLVWAWHFAKTEPMLPYAANIAALYASAVRYLAPYIPWLNAPTPYTGAIDLQALYEAWEMRRNCRQLAINPERSELKMKIAVPDQALLLNVSSGPEHVRLFARRLNWLDPEQRNTLVRKAPAKHIVQLTCSERNTLQMPHLQSALALFTSVVTPFELEFMEALQDLLIERYRKIGLVFEVNPTSNRHIGALSDLKDHPIFRWAPPDGDLLAHGAGMNRFSLRHGALKVCVNTDDPGIMPTTLRTEFELLRRAALDRRFARADVEVWLDDLREHGNAIFEACHSTLSTSAAHASAV